MTQRIKAQKGIVTKEMEMIAIEEWISPEWLRSKVASGRVIIPANRKHKGVKPVGIGEGLRIKVNTNLGTSSDHVDLEEVWKVAEADIPKLIKLLEPLVPPEESGPKPESK